MRRFAAASLLVLGVAASPSTQDDPAPLVNRASRAYRALSSLRADFQQTIEDRMIGTQRASGELVQSGAANLAMRFREPKGDAIILDGTYVWLYTPSTTPDQVIRMAIPSDPVYGPNVLARILDRPTERYAVKRLRSDQLEGRAVEVVEFVPNSADPLFRRAVIWLDTQSALPRRLELDELTGVYRTLTLSRLRTNTPTTRAEFTFVVPSGTRIVDR